MRSPARELRIFSSERCSSQVRAWLLDTFAACEAGDAQWTRELIAAVGEATCNAWQHGSAGGCAPIHVSFFFDLAPVRAVVEIGDMGRGFEPAPPAIDLGQPGHRGRLIMEGFCEVTYERRPPWFVVVIKKRIGEA